MTFEEMAKAFQAFVDRQDRLILSGHIRRTETASEPVWLWGWNCFGRESIL